MRARASIAGRGWGQRRGVRREEGIGVGVLRSFVGKQLRVIARVRRQRAVRSMKRPSFDADRPRRIVDNRFAGLGVALVGAMTLDTYSTFKSAAWCPSCREGDPDAAPFVKRGPAVTYSAGVLFDTGTPFPSECPAFRSSRR